MVAERRSVSAPHSTNGRGKGEMVAGTLQALDRVTPRMREQVALFVRLIQELFGESAKALTVFGGVLTDAFHVDRDTARSVLVVERVELPLLRRLADQGAKLGKAGVAAPLIMTPHHIQTSLDTFPLEFLEIQAQHVTLFGPDYFNDIAFEKPHVRLQCERELKRTLIGLRQALLASAGRERLVPGIGIDAAETLVRTLRGLLWLKDRREFKDTLPIIAEVETLAARKLPGIRAALDHARPSGWSDFDRLYDDVDALGEIVNGW
jgi:hypothetical protein